MFVGVGASRVRDLFQTRPEDGQGHHLRGRDRLDRPQARGRPRRRSRRAGADAQPDALRDGRLRGHRGHRDDRGHEPARHPRPRPPPPRPLRPPGRRAPARGERAGGDPAGPLQGQAPVARRRPHRGRPRHARHVAAPTSSNLVNEAALYAVRGGEDQIANGTSSSPATACSWAPAASRWPSPTARRRPSPTTRVATPCAAAVLPNADPVHKVTILPMGMALGVTQQLPMDDRHIYRQDYIEDSLVVRMGGRIAEDLVFGVISTGANNDLVGSTRAGPQDGARVGHVRPSRPHGLGLAGGRCSSATTSCTRGTTPTRPPG